MTAKELWDECYDAYMKCPQARPILEDQIELGWGEYGKIRNGTMDDVIAYWRSPYTVGGRMLWNTGYGVYVSDEAKCLINPEINKRYIVV
jgi:hypothetical protein